MNKAIVKSNVTYAFSSDHLVPQHNYGTVHISVELVKDFLFTVYFNSCIPVNTTLIIPLISYYVVTHADIAVIVLKFRIKIENKIRVNVIIRINKAYKFTLAVIKSSISCRCYTTIFLMDYINSFILFCKRVAYYLRSVIRAIIYQNDIQILITLA